MLIYVRHMLSGPFSNWESQKTKQFVFMSLYPHFEKTGNCKKKC